MYCNLDQVAQLISHCTLACKMCFQSFGKQIVIITSYLNVFIYYPVPLYDIVDMSLYLINVYLNCIVYELVHA